MNVLLIAATILGCIAGRNTAETGLSRYVDPFIGTAATGHTFPAACVPFGMVQAGPDTGNKSWDYCGGYRYDDGKITMFSQTHVNGTGCADLGDIGIMPFVGDVPTSAAFDHAYECAEPGYYAVTLSETGMRVEVTASEHAAIYRITPTKPFNLLVDLSYGLSAWGDPIKEISGADVALDGLKGLSGAIDRSCWVKRSCAFAMRFDRDAALVKELPKEGGRKVPRYVYSFDASSPLLVKVAISAEGGSAGAKANMFAEIPGWSFNGVREGARRKWDLLFARATCEGSADQKCSWYTALYHLFIQPNNIADAGKRPFYSTLSCWDTFRAAHPLYTIVAADRVPGMVSSMLEQGKRTGFLPIWTLWGKDNQCMIGTHSIPVIVDWFLKSGATDGFDWNEAYAQIKDTLTKPHKRRIKENWDLYDKYGYYPFDFIRGESVSRTMECAYDDWCAGKMAERLGHAEDAAFFAKRAGYWKNVLDPTLGMVRGRDSKGAWRTPYSPFRMGHGSDTPNDFTEGNAFQYTWHVMQDLAGIVAAMGGREEFVKRLDGLFTAPDTLDHAPPDVTGLIGQYVHGNEPSHHVIYFYPQVGRPDRAAERVREVFDRFYLPKSDGLCGNDDCGQMSAWYIFSAMGFYPFNPCGGEYVLGAPQIPAATLRLGNGKTFRVEARGLSRANKYVSRVTLDGKDVKNWKISHADILKGGTLVFEMSDRAVVAK